MKRRNLKRKIIVLLCTCISFLLLSTQSMAQETKKITGKVVANASGQGVGNATITVRGTRNSVATNSSGEFTINAATGETLTITSVGFTPQTFKVTNATTRVSVSLAEDYGKMDEVVIVGYGKMKKTDLSSSQVSVSAADIAKTVNTTLDQALQGRAANVYVTSNSGQPGAASSVIIRGISSLTGSVQPLYVIDGVQMRPGNGTGSNLLSGINPDDIESMSVLQGPSATAIFGAVGAGGVVMITTKRGKAGETKISYSAQVTIQDQPKYIPVMNLKEYATYRNEIQKAGGTASDSTFADPSVLGPGNNWQEAMFRRSLLQKHQLSLSGGTDKTTFYLSGEYFNQEGIAPGSGFTRASMRLNLDNQTRKWLKIGTNLSLNRTNEKVTTSNAGMITLAIQQNPSIPVKNVDGSWGGPANTQYQFSNPLALASINNDFNKSTAIIGGAYADITLLKGLVFHNEGNTSLQYSNNNTFHPSYQFNGLVNATTVSTRASNTNFWWNFNTRLQYDTKVGKHSISAMAAHEASAYGGDGLSGSRQNFVTNTIQELSGGDQTTSIANSSKSNGGSKESYFGRAVYVYNDRYILQATDRYDGSSVFGEAKRWGNFPAVSAAWRISQENFMQSIPAINDLKLRVEYGANGNSNASGYYAVLQSVPTGWGTGFLSQNFSNPFMQWEVDKTVNVGFDLHMLNNRIEVIADAYTKNADKLLTVNPHAYLYGGDISYSAGYVQWPTTNVGSMQSKGFGVTINTTNVQNKQFTWKTGVNVSVDRNKITKLLTPINTINGSAYFLSEVGQSVSMMTGYTAEGLFKDYTDITTHAIQTSNRVMTVGPGGTWVGDIKFKDISGPNGKPDGFIDQYDRHVIGNPWPKFTFGFNNSFTYKEFDLNIFVIGSIGGDILNYSRYQSEIGNGTYGNYLKSVANFGMPSSYKQVDSTSVTLTNPGYQIPRIAPGDPSGNNRINQWDVEDGTYVRVKNVSLSYRVPTRLVAKVGIKGIRLAMNVQNLLTITKYKGYDPEVGMTSSGGTLMVGLDAGRYPNVRMYTFNVVADF
ncbi:MAG: TonB-dependent receptor [Ferruginibacter sp.]|nr:TonB-dependent receptor [Ferruginibacter sp.]